MHLVNSARSVFLFLSLIVQGEKAMSMLSSIWFSYLELPRYENTGCLKCRNTDDIEGVQHVPEYTERCMLCSKVNKI